MDSDDLRAFVAFAEHRSLTHAAKQMNLSQPALFAVVKRLGEDVGAALYVRRGRNLELTHSGKSLLAHARATIDAEQKLRAQLRGDDDGTVALACGEGALVHVVSHRIARFTKAHPGRLRIRIADGKEATRLLHEGEVHAAVLATNDIHQLTSTLPETCVAKRLCTSRVQAVGAAVFLPPGDDIDAAQLSQTPLILPAPGRPLRESVSQWLSSANAHAHVVMEASGWAALATLARLHVGVAVLNDVVPVPKGLRARPLKGHPPVHYVSIATRGHRRGDAPTWAERLQQALHAAAD